MNFPIIDWVESGNRIRMAREYLDVKSEELANKVGITKKHMEHIEQGYSHPSHQTLRNIANALKISCEAILLGDSFADEIWELKLSKFSKKNRIVAEKLLITVLDGLKDSE